MTTRSESVFSLLVNVADQYKIRMRNKKFNPKLWEIDSGLGVNVAVLLILDSDVLHASRLPAWMEEGKARNIELNDPSDDYGVVEELS